ncbi:Hypothetical_protein [Hexamita inflata]|uniref:Hypothetical_protein n=2 Tax=Hexamita inflata TaxID=28002 RepID=A0AA86PBA8_9EUKA|nr:Hypothetical protein HINF_LOCUS23225 [Hexamita inflata]
MMTSRIVTLPFRKEFSLEHIHEILELGFSGLQLKKERMHFFNAINHGGELLLYYHHLIYHVEDNKLVQFQQYNVGKQNYDEQEPLSSSSSYSSSSDMDDAMICSLFSFNQNLFKREYKKLSVYRNNQFEMMKDLNGYYFQFCNNILVLELNDDDNDEENEEFRILKLIDNCETQLILNASELQMLPFITCGVLILCNDDATTFIDMMTSKVVSLPTREAFKLEQIHEILELSNSGLQLKKEILIEIFGEEFPNQIKQCYDSYIQDQINNFPIYSQNCNQLLPFSVLYQYFSDLDLERKDKISQNLTSLTNKIRSQEETLGNKLETASQLLNQAVSQLELLSSVEVCQ